MNQIPKHSKPKLNNVLAEVRREKKMQEINEQYAKKNSWITLGVPFPEYTDTAHYICKDEAMNANPAGYLIKKSRSYFVVVAMMVHLLQILVLAFGDAMFRKSMVNIFFQIVLTALAVPCWKQAFDKSLQLRIDDRGIDLVYQRTAIEWQNVLSTHIKRQTRSKGYGEHLVINHYIPSRDVFEETEVDIAVLAIRAKTLACRIEYFKRKAANA